MRKFPSYNHPPNSLFPETEGGGDGSFKNRVPNQFLVESMDWGRDWVQFIAEHFKLARVGLSLLDRSGLPAWVASYPPGEFPPSAWDWEIKDPSLHYTGRDGIFLLTDSRNPIGWLVVETDAPQPISQEVQDGIMTLLPLLSRELIWEQHRSRLQQAENSITLLLQSSFEVQSVLPQILEVAAKALEADIVLASSQSPATEYRSLLAVHGMDITSLMEEWNIPEMDWTGHPASGNGIPVPRHDGTTYPTHIHSIQRRTQINYQTYLGLPLIGRNEPVGVLEFLWNIHLELTGQQEKFLERITRQMALAMDRSSVIRDMRHASQGLMTSYNSMFEGLTRILGLRDHETEEHTLRVTRLTMRLVESMHIPSEQWGAIRRGALLHDIGKLGVPDAILLKPGSLSDVERRMMELHVIYGYNILSPISNAPQTLDIVLYHHERWDGSGYPSGLRGEQIPLVARLFAVVDVYDALTTDRPYRTAWVQTKALSYLKEQTGRQFDPRMVAAFLQIVGNETGL